MFFVIFASVLLLDGLFWFWADRTARRLPPGAARAWRVAVALFVGLQLAYLLSLLVFPGFRRVSHHYMPPAALAVMYVWHLIVLPVWGLAMGAWSVARLAYLAVGALVRWLSRASARNDERSTEMASAGGAPAERAWSRRQLLTAAAVATPPLLTLGLAGFGVSRLGDLRVRAMDVPVAGLPPALDGLSIAHVTDVHVGRYTRGAHLARIAEATNRLKADLVLMTGDLLDGSIHDLPEALDFVRRIDPRLGLVMCEGNHDLFDGAETFRRQTKSGGVPLLVGEAMTLEVRGEPVQLLGTRWTRGEERIAQSVEELAPLRDLAALNILLAHHPHCFDYAARIGIPLTLAGHTHGGQLMLSESVGFGPAMFRYWSGLYGGAGGAKLVVSNGAGNWFPLRANAPAEILHLTLRRA